MVKPGDSTRHQQLPQRFENAHGLTGQELTLNYSDRGTCISEITQLLSPGLGLELGSLHALFYSLSLQLFLEASSERELK